MRQLDRFSQGRLRVLVYCPTLGVGGAEQWLAALVRHASGLRFVGCLVQSGEYSETSGLLRQIPIWYQDRDPKATARASRTPADVILTWAIPEMPGELRALGIPVVQVSHSSGAEAPLTQSHAVYRVRAGETQANFLAAVCSSAALVYAPEVRESEQITVIYNGSDLERSSPRLGRETARKDLGIPEDSKVLLFNGRFSPEKRPEVVIEAAKHLGPDWCVVMHGWGKMAEPLRKSAEACPRRVVFPRPRIHGIGDLYALADVVALPSATEAMPLVILEALQAGRPVVTSRFGTVPELQRLGLQIISGALPIGAKELADLVEGAAEVPVNFWESSQRIARERFSASAMAASWETYLASCVSQWHRAGIYSEVWDNGETHRPSNEGGA